jgi:hypothetical protein
MHELNKFPSDQVLNRHAMDSIAGGVKPTNDNRSLKFDNGVVLGLDGVGYSKGSHTVTARPNSINPPSGVRATYTWDIGRDLSKAAEKGGGGGCIIL